MATDTKNESTDGLRRRGVFAGAIAAAAALVLGRSAPAAAEDNAPLMLGTKNTAFNETSLEKQAGPLGSPIASPAFSAMQGMSAARLGNAPVDTSRFPVGSGGRTLNMAAVAGESDGNIGVFGNAGPDGVGLWGASEKFIGTWGASLEGVGVLGQTYPTDIAGHETPYPAAGVLGVGGRAPGTWGLSSSGPGAWGQSNTGPGVLGQTGMSPAGALGSTTGYPAAGVYGVGGDAVGVWGVANRGVGSWGQSNTGPGVLGQTGAINPGPVGYPPSGVLGIGNSPSGSGVIGWIGTPAAGASYPRAAVLGVGNQGGTGIWGLANGGGIGTWGSSMDGIGVSGESANNIGAWFKVGNVTIVPKDLESAAVHTTAMGTHVSMCARAEMGVALMAEISDKAGTGLMIEAPEGAVAIHAMGRIVSSEIMLANVAVGMDALSIPCNEINAMSHVSINLRNNVGAMVSFVELQPGVGIIVHFDRKTRAAGTLTYAVSEMMGGTHP